MQQEKRAGKTRATKSRLGFVSHWLRKWRKFCQPIAVVKQSNDKHDIHSDTELKTALTALNLTVSHLNFLPGKQLLTPPFCQGLLFCSQVDSTVPTKNRKEKIIQTEADLHYQWHCTTVAKIFNNVTSQDKTMWFPIACIIIVNHRHSDDTAI